MRLTVKHARYDDGGGYPFLALTLGLLGPGGSDRVALVGWEQKPTLVAAGWIYLGDEFEDVVPTGQIAVPAPGSPGGFTLQTLRGFTGDPVVLDLYRRFVTDVATGDFVPGATLPIPDFGKEG